MVVVSRRTNRDFTTAATDTPRATAASSADETVANLPVVEDR